MEIFTRPNTNATILASKYYHMINAIHCYSWIMYKPTFISFNFRDAIIVLSSGSETNSPEMESDDQVSAS